MRLKGIGNGWILWIERTDRRVVKFNPLDKSLTEIGPDFGEGGGKWRCGVLAKTGCIYCAPAYADHILKINTNDGTVETLDDVEMSETGRDLWASGALAEDNYIYYMPYRYCALQIMRLNADNDICSSVGDDLGEQGGKYIGTVVGNDDCVYGIPHESRRIFKYNPADPDTTSTVGGEEAEEGFYCAGNGVLGGDGYIYAANGVGQVLKVDTANNNYAWIGDRIYSGNGLGWGNAIIGVDKCINWPPLCANRALKFDPATQQLPSLVGDDLGERKWKWKGGALAATDGVSHLVPLKSSPLTHLSNLLVTTMQNSIQKYPQELFAEDECNETFYGSAVRKFGIEKVF